MTCNYSTPYPIPESTEYYLYDRIGFTISSYYERTAVVDLRSVFITRPPPRASTTLFNSFFIGGAPRCLNAWENRCNYTFDQDDSCGPCNFSVTVSDYNTSTDDIEYVSYIETNTGTQPCFVPLPGKIISSVIQYP